MSNEITIVGNTTSPVELRYTQAGKAVGNVTVAVNRKRGDAEETDFHRVTLWEGLAENAAQLDKGVRVVVLGRLASREYEDREGNKRTSWEITADAFGPDLRFATAQVTRTGLPGARTGDNSTPGYMETGSNVLGAQTGAQSHTSTDWATTQPAAGTWGGGSDDAPF